MEGTSIVGFVGFWYSTNSLFNSVFKSPNLEAAEMGSFFCHECKSVFDPENDGSGSEVVCSICGGEFVEFLQNLIDEESIPSSLVLQSPRAAFPLSSLFSAAHYDDDNSDYSQVEESTQEEDEEAFPLEFSSLLSNSASGSIARNLLNMLSVISSRRGRHPSVPSFERESISLSPELARLLGFHGNMGDYAFGNEDFNRIVQRLFDQANANTEQRPADSETIRKFQTIPTVSKEQLNFIKDTECAVCKDTLKVGDTLLELPCSHHYHKECIIAWLGVVRNSRAAYFTPWCRVAPARFVEKTLLSTRSLNKGKINCRGASKSDLPSL